MKNTLYIICLLSFAIAGCNKTSTDKMADAAKTEVVDKLDPALAWRSQTPKPGEARPIQLGESNSFELDNGLKVIVVENHKLPRVSYQLSFRFYWGIFKYLRERNVWFFFDQAPRQTPGFDVGHSLQSIFQNGGV